MDKSETTPRIKLLAIDTSTQYAAIALWGKSPEPRTAQCDPDARHGRVLIPTIQALLESEGLKIADLDGIVVGIGPGSYTGLRIGLTAAKTFAFVEKKRLATFDSLELVAWNAPPDALIVSAIGDAQRGDLYAATFTRKTLGLPLIPSRPTAVISLHDWAQTLDPETFVLGPAFLAPKLSELIPRSFRLPLNPDDHRPNGKTLAKFALDVWLREVPVDPMFLEPAYFRKSAAEEQWEKRK